MARENRRRRKNNAIKTYAESSEAEKQIMDQLIEAIDNEPDNVSLIQSYGSEPMQQVGQIADELIAIQKTWSSAASSLDTPFERVKKKMNEKVDLSTLSGGVDLLKDTGEKGASMLIKAGTKIGDFFTGKAKKREEYEQLIAELDDTLPTLLADMNDLTDDLKDSLEDLDNVQEQSFQMGKAWTKAVRELEIYIKAGEEQYRRYKEEIVPDAQEEAEGGDFEAQNYLNDVVTSQDALNEQLTQLTTQMAMSRQCAEQLHKIRKDITTQRQQINNFLTNALDMWKGMIATASAASTSLKVSANIRVAGDFSSEIMDQSMNATEASNKLMIENQKRGVIDSAKVIENLQRTDKLLTDAATAQQNRAKLLEDDRKNIQAAAENLNETTRRLAEGKMLEGPSSGSSSSAPSSQSSKVANDDKAESKVGASSLLDAFENADTPAEEAPKAEEKAAPKAKKAAAPGKKA